MSSEYTIQSRAVDRILNALLSYGVGLESLFAAFDLKDESLSDPDERMAFDKFLAVYEEAARLSGDPDFGLHISERVKPGMFDVLGYAVANSPTLGECFNRIIRYQRIWMDGAEFYLEHVKDAVRMTYNFLGNPTEETRQDTEGTMATLLNLCRMFTDVSWNPDEVWFEHAEPTDTTEHQRIFACPIRFGSPSNTLLLDPKLLDLPVVQADPGLCAVFDRMAHEKLERLPKHHIFCEKVRAVLLEALKGGDPSLEAVSTTLHITPRTLQRRLKEDGCSHQQLLEELRRELSMSYLKIGEMGVGEVAFLLGFADPSTFHRAFKRWTGMTPGEYRKGLTQGKGA